MILVAVQRCLPQTIGFVLVSESKVLVRVRRRGFRPTLVTLVLTGNFVVVKPFCIFGTLRSGAFSLLFVLIFSRWLSAVFENTFFLIRDFSLRHYHSLWHVLYPHNLQHMLSILFQVVLQLWLGHLCNLAKFESDLEALLKHCLFVVRTPVL